jgi:hypothetical protein
MIFGLFKQPGDQWRAAARAAFLHDWGTDDGYRLGIDLLADAVRRRDGRDAELSLTVTFAFGQGEEHLPLLLEMAPAAWHHSHENVISSIAGYRTPAAVDTLYAATQWVPEYLGFDEARALAVKAIWGLGAIRDHSADVALERLTGSDHEIIALNARQQLDQRRLGRFGVDRPGA